MFLQNSQKKIEEEFLKLTKKLGGDKEPLKTICGKLADCDRDLALAMKYLYVTAPYSDLVNYSFEDIKDFAAHGLFLYNNLERVHELPEEMFLNYILDHRVNEEEVLPCRSFFWDELKDRIAGKNAKDTAIEVNYWCAQEATYHSGDDRTLPALTVYRRGYGRCGEESVFLVNALRSVGIPARQVYVPRWSHCDDNHAWVELWCDGKWYFTGACEPLMILNKGWFTNASSRAMMVHSRLFDLFPAEGEMVIGKEGAAVMLNQTARYARVKTIFVKVTDKAGAPVKGAHVQFQVLNMGEYFPIAKTVTDEKGVVSLLTGFGSVRVLAFHPEMEGFAQADLDTREQDEISLTLTNEPVSATDWTAVDVIAPVDTPVNPDMPTPEQKAEGTRRLNEANKIRREKKENWVNPEIAVFLGKDDEKELRQALMDVLTEKDHTDCISSVLEEHLEYGKVYAQQYRAFDFGGDTSFSGDESETPQLCERNSGVETGYDIYVNYVLNPRVEDELLRPYRKGISAFLTEDQKRAFRADPVEIWKYIQMHITAYPENERETVMETPYECLVSGIGTGRSQKVLFVAIARTLGIPARLNPGSRVMEYWDGTHFVSVLKQEEWSAALCLKKEEGAEWNYYQNWTIGRLVGNEFVSLDLTGRTWENNTLKLGMIPGTYRIITTNRLPNGNQFSWEKIVIVKENEKHYETLRLRQAQLGDMLERISLPEFEVKDAKGCAVSCAGLTSGGKKILMWLEESCEPTEHILNEMLEHAEKFHEFENSVSFMIRTTEAKHDPLLGKVLKVFPKVSVYYDSFEENIELLGRRMYVDPDKLPLILVTNGEAVGIYATSGYNVGTGDMLIRIMEEVPEASIKKYTEIHPDGKRAYQFVADTAYIRESGTKGEHKAAEYIMREAEKAAAGPGREAYIQPPRMELFQCPDFQETKAELVICQPYEKAYPVRAYLNGACTQADGVTAPFLFVGKGDDISLSKAKGAIVLVCDPVREPLIEKIKEAGAAGFVTVCGTPLDQGEDKIPVQYRRKASDLPGASIHFTDAVEIVEKGASVCRLNIQQKEIIRNSANVAVRIMGSDLPEEIVTVTAHYDSVPEGPGAYDNMSGGAMVMEAFHYFAEHRPARTMEFIWFGSEEKGLVGSQNYVKTHADEIGHHILNLNVDLAGQLLGGNVLGVTADPTLCVNLKELMELNGLGVTIKNQVWASDSNTFAWKGVPALTLNRDGFGMHTRHDTVEYISPKALEEGAKTLCAAASWAADEKELSFRREIPEDMQRELERYFA